jgi:hypothetical protein
MLSGDTTPPTILPLPIADTIEAGTFVDIAIGEDDSATFVVRVGECLAAAIELQGDLGTSSVK